jgi:hypothetical protein
MGLEQSDVDDMYSLAKALNPDLQIDKPVTSWKRRPQGLQTLGAHEMQTKSRRLGAGHAAARSSDWKCLVLVLINIVLMLHLLFVGRGLSETHLALSAAIGDVEMWRRLTTQSANVCFVGAFFLGEFVALVLMQRRRPNGWSYMNFGVAFVGFLVAVYSGMNSELLLSGMR